MYTIVLVLIALALFSQGHANYVRLSGGHGPWEGRLEIYSDGHWGTVCDDGFGVKSATVVCRMFGYQRGIASFTGSRFGSGSGYITLDEVRCTGQEDTIVDCPRNEWYSNDCKHDEDVGVSCIRNGTDPVEGVRLIGGTGPYEGTVELNINGVWGTICDDRFDIYDAEVICRMAGYPSALQALEGSYFGPGNGSVLLDELQCTGHENNVDNCTSAGWFNSDCDHDEDAGIACLGSNRSHAVEAVRLVGGLSPLEGRIELNVNGEWGTICDDHFDVNDAKVICNMAGFSSKGHIQVLSGIFGAGKGSILLDELQCHGTETNIEDCKSKGWYNSDCHHDEDVGISCRDNGPVVG